MSPPGALDVEALASEHLGAAEAYREILRAPSLSVGLYKLPRGDSDPQRPHAEDEVYCTLRGRARLRIGDDDHEVAPGSLHFVARFESHAFHAIEEDLMLLVFFAPAEGTTDGGDA